MPPKKKKGKKSAKKKSARKSATKGSATVIAEVLNELSKEFYVVQIRDLENKLSRYQQKCDELEISNKEVDSKFDQQATDKKEIISFLKKQLEQRADEIADLQERLIGLQHAKDTEKDKYELQLTTLRTEMQEMKDQLTSENMVLGGKLASLEEFRVQKEELMSKFEQMELMLKKQEEEHRENIYQLERKQVVDKDRLKKEMILRVNTVAAEFRKVSNKQMAETTKRTIRENVGFNSQLTKMSEKTIEMIGENDEHKEKERKQKQNLEILEYNEKELMKKNAANQKVIRMLTDKGKEQDDFLQQYQQKDALYKQLEEDYERTRTELAAVNERCAELHTENLAGEEKQKADSTKKKTLSEEKDYLIMLLSESADVIKESLQQNEKEDIAKREASNGALLQKVVDILGLAAQMGVGVSPEQLQKKRSQIATSPSHEISPIISKRSVDLPPPSLMHRLVRPLAHYKLGDLGLVPASRKNQNKMAQRRSNGKAKLYSAQQLASGTPELSMYNLVAGGKSPVDRKLPLLSPIKKNNFVA